MKAALADVKREAREAEITQLAKNGAMAALDEAIVKSTAFVAASSALGGLDEIASRIRPTRRASAGSDASASGTGASDAPANANPPTVTAK